MRVTNETEKKKEKKKHKKIEKEKLLENCSFDFRYSHDERRKPDGRSHFSPHDVFSDSPTTKFFFRSISSLILSVNSNEQRVADYLLNT